MGAGRRTQSEPSTNRWTVFNEWSGGSELRQTERFTTTSARWRVSWKVTSGDPIGTLSIHVRNKEDVLVAVASNLQGGPDFEGIRPGSVRVLSEPGEHYLEIESAGVNWHVTAEYNQ